MGREARRVAKDWQHPKDEATGRYKPLFEGYTQSATEFMEKANTEGLQAAVGYFGRAPDQEDYMPDWPAEERTHLQMYETTSEGTPISPVMATPEDLARWLVDNNASAFAGQTASYEAWLRVAKGGYACSAVMSARGFESGVDAMTHL